MNPEPGKRTRRDVLLGFCRLTGAASFCYLDRLLPCRLQLRVKPRDINTLKMLPLGERLFQSLRELGKRGQRIRAWCGIGAVNCLLQTVEIARQRLQAVGPMRRIAAQLRRMIRVCAGT